MATQPTSPNVVDNTTLNVHAPASGANGAAPRVEVLDQTHAADRSSPYQGLEPYHERDQLYFFGREREQDIIEANLFSAPLTVLYGASGVGKTSLLLAGALPALRRARRTSVVVVRTWQDPGFLEVLKHDVLEALRASGGVPDVDVSLEFDEFLLKCRKSTRQTLLLIFDQFEEYFLYNAPSSAPDSFDAQFARAVNRDDIDAHFLLAMREDALSGLDRFHGRIPTVLSNPVRLEHLTVEGARAAIRKPLEQFNAEHAADSATVSIDADLVDRVLGEVKLGRLTLGQSGRGAVEGADEILGPNDRVEASYLQLVMLRLWEEERHHGSSCLQLATLQRLGGAQRIVQTHLDTEMQALSPAERRIAADIFDHLVTPSGTKIALSAHDLAKYADLPDERVRPIVDRLARSARVLRSVDAPHGAADRAPRYEIYHDVLAAAILDWRARYLERAALFGRLRTLVTRLAVVVIIALVALGAILLYGQIYSQFEDSRAAAARAALIAEEQLAASTADANLAKQNADQLALKQAFDNQTARARNLAAAAVVQLNTDPQLSLRLARAAADEANTPDTLDGAERALRRALAESHLRTALVGHYSELNSTVFSPDGRHVLTASRDGQARIWNPATGETELFFAPDQQITRASYNADGTRVLTLCADGTVVIWDAASGSEIRRLQRHHTKEAYDATYSPDGKWIATASADGTAFLWPSDEGEPIRLGGEGLGHTGPVISASFSPDSQFVLTASDDQTARVWSVETGEQMYELRGAGPVTSASFSPDGQWIVTSSSWDGNARVWDAHTPGDQPLLTLAHPRPVSIAVFSPVAGSDGRLLLTATGGDDADAEYVARIWLVPQGTQVAELRGHTGPLFSAAFSPDGRFAVTASKDSTARVWDVASGSLVTTLRGHTLGVSSAVFDATGQRVVTGSWDHTARVWDITETPAGNRLRHLNDVAVVGFDPDNGSHVLTGTAAEGAIMRVWSLDSSEVVQTLVPDVGGAIRGIAFAPARRVIVTNDSRAAGIWDTVTGAVVERITAPGAAPIANVALSPDAKRIAIVSTAMTVPPLIRDVGSQDHSVELRGHDQGVNTIRFSRDGSRVVTASNDGTARVWAADTGQELVVLRGHTDDVVSAEFNPDSVHDSIVTASADGTARLWDARSGAAQGVLRAHQGALSRAVFNPSGTLILTAGRADRTVRLWDITGELVRTFRAHEHGVLDAQFSPDGGRIASAGKDHWARVYTCEVCGSFAELRTLAAQRALDLLTSEERTRYGGS